ncbi:glycosyltransferase family 9 protein [candidate division KSB1 bacterium]
MSALDKLKNTVPENIKSILIIGSIGIGNLLLFSGTLRRMRSHFSNARISIIVLKSGFRDIYENDPSVDEVIVLDINKIKTIKQKTGFILSLRKNKYDICVTTFPANRIEYNILARLSGARFRITHGYDTKALKTLSFLQNIRIPVDKGMHDLEQNLNLLTAFGISPAEEDRTVTLPLIDEKTENAKRYLIDNDLSDKLLIGMHAGSSSERGMHLKRWQPERFAELADWIKSEYNAVVMLFGGPEELELREKIRDIAQVDPHIVKGADLLTTAALISRCRLFITNDSGLMHVSVAAGVQTVALFGPSDPGRTAPYGDKHKVIRLGMDCSPCWSIKNLGVGWVNCIHPENYCMLNIEMDTVAKIVSECMKS